MTSTKILQILVDGQTKARKDRSELKKMINDLDGRLTERIDALGKQLNVLDEDAPTREEHNKLEKRVGKLEHQFATN